MAGNGALGSDRKQSAPVKGSSTGLIVAMALVTLIAGGSGFAGGAMLPRSSGPAPIVERAPAGSKSLDKSSDKSGGKAAPAATSAALPDEGALVAMPNVVTNLARPKGAWVRLEGSLLMAGKSDSKASALAARVAQDILAFLRTLPLEHLEGARGLEMLREDLNERARLRGEGRVRQVVIHSLVIE